MSGTLLENEGCSDKFEELDLTEKVSILKEYQNVVSVSAKKSYLEKKVEEQNERIRKLREVATSDGESLDFVDENILSWIETQRGAGKTDVYIKNEFAAACKKSTFVHNFFKNPQTGVDYTPTLDNSPNFARDFLLLIYSTVVGNLSIDQSIREYEREIQEFDHDYQEILKVLSDNVLLYCDSVEKEVDPKDPNAKKILEDIYYIRGAYDLKPYRETLIKYPTVISHTLEDIRSPRRIKEISARYHEKLGKAGCSVSLVAYINDDIKKSFEYRNLPKGSYMEGYENLFIFSLIRYFSMEHWDSKNLKMHNATINALHKMNTDKLGDDLKQSMRTAIIEYLALFH